MHIHDKKAAVTLIMAKRTPKGEKIAGPVPVKAEVVKDEEGEIDGRQAAAEDILAALHEKSPMKLAEALANFLDLHSLQQADSEE